MAVRETFIDCQQLDECFFDQPNESLMVPVC